MKTILAVFAACMTFAGLNGTTPLARSADEDTQAIGMAEGQLSLTAPAEWERRKPRTNIVEHEFAAAAAEGDSEEGRVTVMGASGTVEENIERWQRQFVQPDGNRTAEVSKVEQNEIAGLPVHIVDISGTFQDQPAGPFSRGPVIEREGYRMLGAIIVGGKTIGTYFVKFYGPKATIDANEQAFRTMLEGLKKT